MELLKNFSEQSGKNTYGRILDTKQRTLAFPRKSLTDVNRNASRKPYLVKRTNKVYVVLQVIAIKTE